MQAIVANARDCEQNHRDENAWCMDVVQPLLGLAIKEMGSDEWFLQSVLVITIRSIRVESDLLVQAITAYSNLSAKPNSFQHCH